MNNHRLAACAAALMIFAGVPAVSLAQTAATASPIVLHSNIEADSGHFDRYVPGVINATFTNVGTATITEVVFEVSHDGTPMQRIEDVGSYAPGSTTHHTFPDVHEAYDQRLDVAEVHFADGSVWQPSN